ncbi:diacylglycerol/lipid kinase family protein [Dichotomicrobium thermohalophilum]|uniref:Diacylglycerol kinase family enzyme n=1 Tax=Dichotomicrobium thermohalophilum TaxID=933063 RepID=A0A397Q6K2_9HYPH|nr:diacylglycerol kinase family protein [Dichotomicrobium thermohalophilum]RIA56678.1 diacylglycerol kinase family enzyme [Dichotomicrobium thermohalophilum]
MRKRFLIVHNPNAGSGRRRLMRGVLGALEHAGAEVAVQKALSEDSGRAIASEAARTGHYDAIVAAGGDGTIRSVAAGLRGSEIPVGILPLGTGNVMANEIGLPRQPDAIARYLLDGVAVPVAGAVADDTPFFLMAGAGLDAEAVAGLNNRLKRWIGKLAYVWPVVRGILRPAPTIQAVLDGKPHHARWVVLCKAGSYAGGFRLSPDSHLFMPGLTAVLCTARDPFSLTLNILMIGAGQAKHAPHLHFVRCRRAHLGADRRVAVQIDGESHGELPVSISEDHTTVHLLAPAETAAAFAHQRARAAA